MNKKIAFTVIIFSLVSTLVFSQDKTKKELKEERKIEKQMQTEALINAKDFIFVGKTAHPTGMRSIDLTTNTNWVKFQPEMIESEMPFYGRAYSGIGYGTDAGLKFKGKPEEFKVTKGKKNYQVDVTVKGTSDNYKLSITVGFEGGANLTIISNNRSSITYTGEISAPK